DREWSFEGLPCLPPVVSDNPYIGHIRLTATTIGSDDRGLRIDCVCGDIAGVLSLFLASGCARFDRDIARALPVLRLVVRDPYLDGRTLRLAKPDRFSVVQRGDPDEGLHRNG